MLRIAKTLEDYELRARDGAIGRVKDIYFDDARWQVRYFVVDTGSWLTGRTVLIAAAALTVRDWPGRTLSVDLTREQVRHSPSVDTAKPVSRQHEEELHRYYTWPYYWTAPLAGGAFITPMGPGAAPTPAEFDVLYPEINPDHDRPLERGAGNTGPEATDDPHLRSVHELRGYHLAATNGSVGHLEDLVLNEETWAVAYLLVDTRNWWPDKLVILTPGQIRAFNWSQRAVEVALTREAIQASPEFDEARLLDADYIERLKEHYEGFVRDRSH